MLAALVHSAVAKALGWALVHSLWEGALIALLVGVGFLLCRPASARMRYALACAGLLAMLAAFGVTLAILWPAPNAPVTLAVASRFHAAPLGPSTGISVPPVQQPDRSPWIVPFGCGRLDLLRSARREVCWRRNGCEAGEPSPPRKSGRSGCASWASVSASRAR